MLVVCKNKGKKNMNYLVVYYEWTISFWDWYTAYSTPQAPAVVLMTCLHTILESGPTFLNHEICFLTRYMVIFACHFVLWLALQT